MSNLRVRRATVDDLGVLRPIWQSMRLNAEELEPRLTEFQIVTDAAGTVLGGIGFQISERYANLHSEAFSDFAIADAARPLLWDRMKALALNHGIVRLWTSENAPFWKQSGFMPAEPDVLKKLPAQWSAQGGEWLTAPLKDEVTIVSMEKELALFMEAEKRRTARAFSQAQTMKKIATVVAFIFALFVGAAVMFLIRKNQGR